MRRNLSLHIYAEYAIVQEKSSERNRAENQYILTEQFNDKKKREVEQCRR